MSEGDDPGALLARLTGADRLAALLGIELVESGPGRATVRMRVAESHANFNGTCHGGAIFALADTAFGLASNSHGVVAAGVDAHIAYPAPARLGDELTATAVEVSRARRLAVYRVDVVTGDGTAVAHFTGTVYVTERRHDDAG